MSQDNILIIEVHKSAEEIFNFAINPKNTPIWLPAILEEKTSEWPPRVGTIYSQATDLGNGKKGSDAIIITEYIPYTRLAFKSKTSTYRCSYDFEEKDGVTRLVYTENSGNAAGLESPFSQESLEKLKALIETSV